MSENNPSDTTINQNNLPYECHPSSYLDSQNENVLVNSNSSDSWLENCSIANDFLNLDSSSFREVTLSNATLEQALIFFDFPYLLKDLDQDLELVQKQIKSKEDHGIFFNQNVNDKFRRLSVKYHPDRVKNREGTEIDVKKATELQKGVNLIWGILKMLHRNFIDDNYLSDQNFKYSTCSAVEISILSNEERLKNINNKILIELCWLSRIKHEKMIPNINKFLVLSYSCVQSFLSQNESSFRQKRNRAVIHFKWFHSGYNELFSALKKLMAECEMDEELAYIKPSVHRMLAESFEDLKILQSMRTRSRQQYIKYFNRYMYAHANEYFILPFVTYFDLLFKCNEVIERRIEIKNSERRRAVIIGLCQRFRKKVFQREYDEDAEKCNNHFQAIPCNNKVIDFVRKTDDSIALYTLFYHLTNYYCLGETNVILLLEKIYELYTNMNEEVAYTMLIETVKRYVEDVKQEFQPIKVTSECDIKEFKNDIDKAVNEFKTNMREMAHKSLQEIREAQNKIRQEFAQMETRFEAELLNTEEENAKRIEEMEAEINDGNETRRQIEVSLGNEILQRSKLEEELKKRMELDSKIEEQKLRQQSQIVQKESEERISKKFEEILNMKAQLEDLMEQKLEM